MTTYNSTRLVLPALRASMGDWVYYVTFLRLEDVDRHVSLAKEIYEPSGLDDMIQRALTDRSTAIKDYLLTQKQRFFNALVVAVYGGAPQWYELGVNNAPNGLLEIDALPDYLEGAFGFLVLEGVRKYYALDGQHRVVGIRKALEEDPTLGSEEVAAIFVAHRDDPAGMERTRRLFSTLNRYAKPVSKSEIIALDEDDLVAITTRRIARSYEDLTKKILLAKTKNIPVTNKRCITSIVGLYDNLDLFLPTMIPADDWEELKRFRPSDEALDRYYSTATELWETLAGC
jgi:DNA sulfur modification protein DndB